MSFTTVLQDVILYVVVILGILLYKSVLFHQMGQTGRLSKVIRKRQNQSFLLLGCILTGLFGIGILHQLGIARGYISFAFAILFGVAGVILLARLRKNF